MEVLDCLGKRCPLPVIELAKALKSKPIGSQIRLLSDDPASAPDLIAWARMTENTVKEIGESTFEVTKLTD
ncbi:MAG: sulfurtransferase TusA family protein [Actinomycetales bacterium]|nr:MAG: sulfurtransferase TusA family protein [Actinomycetales bacterium]